MGVRQPPRVFRLAGTACYPRTALFGCCVMQFGPTATEVAQPNAFLCVQPVSTVVFVHLSSGQPEQFQFGSRGDGLKVQFPLPHLQVLRH